jgi:transposase-like protein
VQGVSTRKDEGPVRSLGVEHLSKSQVSRFARDLDDEVRASENGHSTGATAA